MMTSQFKNSNWENPPRIDPTLSFRGEYLQFGWGDKKYFYTKIIPKHYFTMDKNFGEIGKGAKEKTNILSRGAPSHGFLYKNF